MDQKRTSRLMGILSILLVTCMFTVTGCSESNADPGQTSPPDGGKTQTSPEQELPSAETPASIREAGLDLDSEFAGITGCAVLYSPDDELYSFYNEELCKKQVSPLSTFKIVSALMGLHAGVLENETTKMEYNGTVYPISGWNKNVTLKEAFSTSCIWYFRQVIDQVGKEEVKAQLDQLSYGNCDIGQWQGNGANPLPELNGFWLNSTLKISPLEQVKVLSDIFEGRSGYTSEEITILKNIMLVSEENEGAVCGKTGSGPGKAWFVGFYEKDSARNYVAVYLEDEDKKDSISGENAKNIALEIINETFHAPAAAIDTSRVGK
ncbi:penicillin-binding transpeptidase domain-containing protein [Anaerolentibacter hominis]|uniref:penicillin-binding transpeptidase domain-containing protein n=1 Tax=Anaerolentibacter hominis TaxID=3079009 RepID=UPI0031B871FF